MSKQNKDNYDSQNVDPINDVTDHYQKHMGLPNKKVDLNTMPRILRYFYYFITGFVIIAVILMIILWILF